MVFDPWWIIWFCFCCKVIGLVGVVASVCEVECPVVCCTIIGEVAVGLCYVGCGCYAGVGCEGPPVVAVVVSPVCCHGVAI